MIRKNKVYLLLFLLQWCATGLLAGDQVHRNIDWSSFMSRQDMIWTALPKSWDEAPFLGNGRMGVQIYRQPGENYLRFNIGNSTVHDHREGSGTYDIPRLLIGDMTLCPQGDIVDGEMRLDLWNAEVRGNIRTTQGAIHFRSYVHAAEMCVITEVTTEGNEKDFRWIWLPARADSPRYLFAEDGKKWFQNPKDYVRNPPAETDSTTRQGICVQKLLAGGETATTWEEVAGKKGIRTLYLNTSHSYPNATARTESHSILKKVLSQKPEALTQTHRKWWNAYYPQSFLTLPEAQKENFYWAQMYKLASATRADRDLIDNTGPWLTVTPWPNAWWNLNVQLTYWALNTSNRLALAESLEKAVYGNMDHLIKNVPEKYRSNSAAIARSSNLQCQSEEVGLPGISETAETGLLLWTCHNLWLIYRHKMDDTLLRDKLLPLLTRAVNFHLHFLTPGEDGKLHLPRTYSPEYGSAEDCNFDLALLRWGCETLLTATQRLNINDPLAPRWKEVLSTLTPYPTDENGLMIGRNEPYTHSHRHYSHLLAIYPLYLINQEQAGSVELIQKSLDYWQSKKGHHEGYSLTGASSISAAIGRGDEALRYLNGLFGQFLSASTMYKEAGPCIETPLSGVQSIHDMLLQSWGGKIRVFPALPTSWKELSFDGFLTEGAFLVSAKREQGKTQFIRIHSRAGEPCVVQTDIPDPAFKSKRSVKVIPTGQGEYKIDLKKGETVIVYPKGSLPDLSVTPITQTEANTFGVKK